MYKTIYKLKYTLFSLFLLTTQVQADCDINLEKITKSNAFNKATEIINKYLEQADSQDKINFINYLNYYKSHYQAVTPAPSKLVNSLSNGAKQTFEKIKKIAQVFIIPQSEQTKLAGSSKLSSDGDNFYKNLIKFINK